MYKCIYFYIHNRMIASYKVKKKKKKKGYYSFFTV